MLVCVEAAQLDSNHSPDNGRLRAPILTFIPKSCRRTALDLLKMASLLVFLKMERVKGIELSFLRIPLHSSVDPCIYRLDLASIGRLSIEDR
jgi:hypothetical protein